MQTRRDIIRLTLVNFRVFRSLNQLSDIRLVWLGFIEDNSGQFWAASSKLENCV